MLEWLANNPMIVAGVLALFGAGGAGAFLIRHFFGERGPSRGSSGMTVKASGGSAAVLNTGGGNVDVRLNELISGAALDAWRAELGLSREGAVDLMGVFARGEIAQERVEALGRALSAQPKLRAAPETRALAEAAAREDAVSAHALFEALERRAGIDAAGDAESGA